MRVSRATWLTNDPLVSSVLRMIAPAVIVQKVHRDLAPLSRQTCFSDLLVQLTLNRCRQFVQGKRFRQEDRVRNPGLVGR